MTGRGALLGAVVLAVAIMGAAAPARAHVRVFVGGAFGFPVVPYPYPYAYPYYGYPAPYPGGVDVPPPGWVAGHWAWWYDHSGRRFRVWIPPHLR